MQKIYVFKKKQLQNLCFLKSKIPYIASQNGTQPQRMPPKTNCDTMPPSTPLPCQMNNNTIS